MSSLSLRTTALLFSLLPPSLTPSLAPRAHDKSGMSHERDLVGRLRIHSRDKPSLLAGYGCVTFPAPPYPNAAMPERAGTVIKG